MHITCCYSCPNSKLSFYDRNKEAILDKLSLMLCEITYITNTYDNICMCTWQFTLAYNKIHMCIEHFTFTGQDSHMYFWFTQIYCTLFCRVFCDKNYFALNIKLVSFFFLLSKILLLIHQITCCLTIHTILLRASRFVYYTVLLQLMDSPILEVIFLLFRFLNTVTN